MPIAESRMPGEPVLVSLSRGAGPGEEARARRLAREEGWEFMPPPDRGTMVESMKGRPVVVVEKTRLSLRVAGSSYAFHPGLAPVRIKRLLAGDTDHMLEAMGLVGVAAEREGPGVLDCTLGFGADAIVAAFAVGENGRVVGLESSPVLAVLTRHGLADWAAAETKVTAGPTAKEQAGGRAKSAFVEALGRIEVVNADHLSFLRVQPPSSFDVVYFDPMFREPVKGAAGLALVRIFGRSTAIEAEVVAEARRVARRRVVMKERRGSPEFARLGCDEVVGGASSSVAFGVWKVPRVSREGLP